MYLFFFLMAVDAIIFLAPISGFDQVLAEDRTVNRLVSLLLLLLLFISPNRLVFYVSIYHLILTFVVY